MANYYVFSQVDANDAGVNSSSVGYTNTVYALGNDNGVATTDACVRFQNVAVNQGITVVSAILRLYIGFAENAGPNLQYKLYGIKETNTANFSSNPFGRTETTNNVISSKVVGAVGSTFDVDVTAIVNEIISQSGWANGNAMGFLIFNNGSANSNYIENDNQLAKLIIQISTPGNFKPTPGTITVGSLPAAADWGVRISAPGIDVGTASESQLYFTSRKKELRISQEGSVAGTTSQLAHGLGYPPCVLGYYNNGGICRIMNVPANVFTVEEYVSSDGTNVIYFLSSTEYGYLYIFIDPLS